MIPVCDLHCDLLSYLASKEGRTVFNEEARCSFPQMQKGGVCFQALAIFEETKQGSSKGGDLQVEAFKKLPEVLVPLKKFSFKPLKEQVFVMAAFENASAFAEEDEPLSQVLERFDRHVKDIGPILYTSLTWNTENRFGGGNHTTIGLKKDGEALLQHMNGKIKAIDLSHASDPLAHDIFNFIDKRGLSLTPIASHSNFRKVKDHPRNLPDDIAKEIIKRKGIMGINLFRHFVGDHFQENLIKIVGHAIELGGEKQLCFGADFFYDQDFNTALSYIYPFFDKDFADASCYPRILHLLETYFPKDVLEGIAYKNFQAFLNDSHR